MSQPCVADRLTARRCGATGGYPAVANSLRPSACLRSTSNQFLRGTANPGNALRGRKLEARRSLGRGLLLVAMAGKVTGKISLALEAGKANPAPPVGPALGAQGVNIMDFCRRYNAETADKAGQIIPVEITVYEDRTFTFITKTPPASFLLKEAAGIKKGAGKPNSEKMGQVTREQLKTIAETKLPDLNCTSIDAAMRTIEGTAKNMGIAVVES